MIFLNVPKAPKRFADAPCEYATRETDQTSRKRQAKGTYPMTCLKVLKAPSSDVYLPPIVRKGDQRD
jgi:hypothetical protein